MIQLITCTSGSDRVASVLLSASWIGPPLCLPGRYRSQHLISPQGSVRRDLISSADTIMDMALTCDSVLGNIKGVQVRVPPTKCYESPSPLPLPPPSLQTGFKRTHNPSTARLRTLVRVTHMEH